MVAFTDLSSSPNDPIISWAWDFGGPSVVPSTSTNQNDTALFANPGVYPVSLIIVTQSGCTDTMTRNNAVTVGLPPTADFITDKDTVCINELITFTSLFNDPDWNYEWDFQYAAPGNFALFDTMATIVYPDTGLFSVALIVEDRGCRDTMIKTDFVYVSPPRAQFSVSDTVVCTLPSTISIQDESLGPADIYEWLLNGNLYSNLQSPPDLTVANAGSYILTQIIENSLSGCRDTFSVIVNAGDPISDFSASDLAGCAPFTTSFTNLAQNYVNHSWRFLFPASNPATSTLEPESHL